VNTVSPLLARSKARPLGGALLPGNSLDRAQIPPPDNAPAVRIEFPDSDVIEDLVVSPLPDSCFRLEESPVLSEFASYGDTIQTNVASDGRLVCRKVVARSPYTTVRWLASQAFIDSPTWATAKERLLACGGNWEQLFGGYLIIHIPKYNLADFQELIDHVGPD
jgi:hypothetical protein